MRVAVGQYASGFDKRRNREVAARLVAAAAAGGAHLVVLPEAAMYPFGSPDTDLAAAAEPLDGPFVEALVTSVADTDLTVVAGLFEPTGIPGLVHNTVVAVTAAGVAAAYRKVHLYDALGWRESARVTPGDPAAPPAVVDVGPLRVGVMTCFDLRFPETARVLVDAGADVLAVPAAWVAGPGKAGQWEVLLRARAIENTAYVLGAGQPEPAYVGHSTIVDPNGDVLVRLGGAEDGLAAASRQGAHEGESAGSGDAAGDGLAFADLEPEVLAARRTAMPLLEARRFVVRPA
jgi:predicted amidohydrolase